METMPLPKKLLSRSEACQYLGIGPTTLWALTTDRRIAVVRIGKRVLYKLSDLERFIERASRASSKA